MTAGNGVSVCTHFLSEDSVVFEFEQRREDWDLRLDELPLHPKLKINLNHFKLP